jgi:hypothetical protein
LFSGRIRFAILQVPAARFTNLRDFFSQLCDALFDRPLHEKLSCEKSLQFALNGWLRLNPGRGEIGVLAALVFLSRA